MKTFPSESTQYPEGDFSLIKKMGISELVRAYVTTNHPKYRDEVLSRLKWCGFDEKFSAELLKLESAIIQFHGREMENQLLCDSWWWMTKNATYSMLPFRKVLFSKAHEEYTLESPSEDTLTISEMLSFLDEANYIRTTLNKNELFSKEVLNEVIELEGYSWLKHEVWMRMVVCGASPENQRDAMELLYKQEIHLLAKNKYDYLADSWEPYSESVV